VAVTGEDKERLDSACGSAPPQSNEVDCLLMRRLIGAHSCVRSFQTNTESNYNHTRQRYARTVSTSDIIANENYN